MDIEEVAHAQFATQTQRHQNTSTEPTAWNSRYIFDANSRLKQSTHQLNGTSIQPYYMHHPTPQGALSARRPKL